MPNQIAIRDGFSVEEKNNSNSLIIGAILKFKDGGYSIDKVYHPSGGRYGIRDVIFAWVHWDGGKPIEHRITPLGERHPERDELPDQDQEAWPAGFDGKPADPWKDTRYLQIIDLKTGRDLTFITDSYGGHRAIGDLRAQIRNVRAAEPNASPIISLGGTQMKTRFGMKPRPQFDILEWVLKQSGGGTAQLQLLAPDEVENPFE
jgi:hypothetical protein